jgi:hypothetical protein
MTGAPAPRHYSPRWNNDTRPTPPAVGGERETLSAVLDWHRATFELKCAGLPPERLSEQAVPPSSLSLHGLVRHLAGAERWWFRIQFAGQDVPMLYYSDDDPDQDFESLDGDPMRPSPSGEPSASTPGRSHPRPRRWTKPGSARGPASQSHCEGSRWT